MGSGFTWDAKDRGELRLAAERGWDLAKEKISSGRYRMVILDELTYALNYGLLDQDAVIDFLAHKPEKLHIVITGRDAGARLIDLADLVAEMKEEIGLTAGQEEKVAVLYREMNEEAVRLGNILIGYERELNDRFAAQNIDEKILDELLGKISATYWALRYTHLAAHLQTPAILTEDQVIQYNKLRGYSADDPCANIPKGHARQCGAGTTTATDYSPACAFLPASLL